LQELRLRFEGKKTLIMGEASTGGTKLTASLLRKATVFSFQHVIDAVVGNPLASLYAVAARFFAYLGGGLGTICDLVPVQQYIRLKLRVRCREKFEGASCL
jgi:hypothetical protein